MFFFFPGRKGDEEGERSGCGVLLAGDEAEALHAALHHMRRGCFVMHTMLLVFIYSDCPAGPSTCPPVTDALCSSPAVTVSAPVIGTQTCGKPKYSLTADDGVFAWVCVSVCLLTKYLVNPRADFNEAPRK